MSYINFSMGGESIVLDETPEKLTNIPNGKSVVFRAHFTNSGCVMISHAEDRFPEEKAVLCLQPGEIFAYDDIRVAEIDWYVMGQQQGDILVYEVYNRKIG